MLIKVCGITEKTCNPSRLQGKADMLGFIFHSPSPRHAFEMEVEDVKKLGSGFDTVGVFVDNPIEHVVFQSYRRGIKTLQLHGKEPAEYAARLKEMGYKVIKAFSITPEMRGDVLNEITRPYEGSADMFLFDTGGKKAGGNGVKFDWSVLRSYSGHTPYLLSGGLAAEDIPAIVAMNKDEFPMMAGIDLNSRFEISPGQKDIDLLLNVLEKIKG